ncbi:MAG TPA: hypothetical protein VF216_12210 [Mizugakiibacter sp.]
MAETPKPWQILQTVATRLGGITQANGYRTDIGATVLLEGPQDDEADAERIVLYSTGIRRIENDRPDRKGRVFEFVIEASVPCMVAAGVVPAHARMHDIVADVEQALDTYLQQPTALPARVEDVVFLGRESGLSVVAAQIACSVEYRR